MKLREVLNYCTKDGISSAVMTSITDYYIIPLALFLGASTQEVGFLVGMPNLLGAISLILTINLINHFNSRLKFMTASAFLQAISLVFISLLSIIDLKSKVLSLIILVIIFKTLGNLINVVWGSITSEYLRANLRGKYFGFRSQVVGITGLISIIFSGIILFIFKKYDAAYGFFIIFICTSLARFLSFYYLSKFKDLPHKYSKEDDFTLLMFLKKYKESNFVKFVFYTVGITFATNIAGPYFSVYMLENLHFNYLEYTSVSVASVIGILISSPIWGRNADIFGNSKILKFTSLLIPIIPFLWLLSKSPIYLTMLEIFSGFIWGGFNLCAINFIYDSVSPGKRVRCLAYFSLINGIAIFISSVLGGYLIQYLPSLLGHQLVTLIIISGILRFGAHYFLSKNFNEIRKGVKSISNANLFYRLLQNK